MSTDLLLDSNLLLLLIIGNIDRGLVLRFKRTNMFTVADYELLKQIVLLSSSVHTTPHILTEVSNLGNALPSHRKSAFARSFLSTVFVLEEHFSPASEIASDSTFALFGLTDAAMLLAGQTLLVLTQDGRLAAYAQNLGISALDLHSAAFLRPRL